MLSIVISITTSNMIPPHPHHHQDHHHYHHYHTYPPPSHRDITKVPSSPDLTAYLGVISVICTVLGQEIPKYPDTMLTYLGDIV